MFKIVTEVHSEGKPICETCWARWPRQCSCGGFEHAEYKNENHYGDEIYLIVKCDKCLAITEKTLTA